MQPELLRAFEARRRLIRTSWENFLRLERTSTPLAHPDALVHLLDRTLDEISFRLRVWSPRRHPTRAAAPGCPCGRNPLLAYFSAGRQAVREALVLAESATPALTAAQRDEAFACLEEVFSHLARREITAFCGICRYRESVGKTARAGETLGAEPVPRQRRLHSV
jgi:hypothetical protein